MVFAGMYVFGIVLMAFIPGEKRREAHVVFLFQNLSAWVLGLVAVEAGWLYYPIRELSKANSTSFVFEFLLYPATTAYFNIYYPERGSPLVQIGWTLLFAAGITLPEHYIEKYTNLVVYAGWQWYWTFCSVIVTLVMSRLFRNWFFRETSKNPAKSGPG